MNAEHAIQNIPSNQLDAQISVLRAQGVTLKETAEATGLTQAAVEHRTRKPELKAFIQSLSHQLAAQTGNDLLQNHVLAIKSAKKAWQAIHDANDTVEASKLATQAKDLLALADAKEKRAGQAMGLFATPAPSIFLQQVFNGPANVVLADGLMELFGKAIQQLPGPGDDIDGDIIDLDET